MRLPVRHYTAEEVDLEAQALFIVDRPKWLRKRGVHLRQIFRQERYSFHRCRHFLYSDTYKLYVCRECLCPAFVPERK